MVVSAVIRPERFLERRHLFSVHERPGVEHLTDVVELVRDHSRVRRVEIERGTPVAVFVAVGDATMTGVRRACTASSDEKLS
jgi:hypothetical protein